jgi:hypothetical protein
MGFIVFWVILSILVGVFASSKKRSGVGWFFLSLIISPLITFIILLVAGSPRGTLKKCPKCAEEIKAEARVCRFCGYEFPKEKMTPQQIQENERLQKVEILRVKFNKLSEGIIASKSSIEKIELRKERDKIKKEMDGLISQGTQKSIMDWSSMVR